MGRCGIWVKSSKYDKEVFKCCVQVSELKDDRADASMFGDSREAMLILSRVETAVRRGLSERVMQDTPHLVLLRKSFYHEHLKRPLAEWLLLWLQSRTR